MRILFKGKSKTAKGSNGGGAHIAISFVAMNLFIRILEIPYVGDIILQHVLVDAGGHVHVLFGLVFAFLHQFCEFMIEENCQHSSP